MHRAKLPISAEVISQQAGVPSWHYVMHGPQYIGQQYLGGRASEGITSSRAALGQKQAAASEALEYLGQGAPRQASPARAFPDQPEG